MHKTSLIVPKDQATKQIEAQIAKGRQMMNSKVRNKGELRALDDALDRWTDYNIQLCRELFSDDSIAREIMRYKTKLYQDWTIKEEARHLRDCIGDQINNLISINERIEIMTVKERTAEAAEQPKADVKEGGVKYLIKTNRHWLFEGIGTEAVKWIGSTLFVVAVFVGGYIWTKQPVNPAQPAPSPPPQDSQTQTATPATNPSPVAANPPAVESANIVSPNATASPYDPNQIVSSVDPATWPGLIGTWKQMGRDQKTGQFEPTVFKVQFYSEGEHFKCKLIFPPGGSISERVCTKLIVDGTTITYSFGGVDYIGQINRNRPYIEGRYINPLDTEHQGDWALTR